MVCPDYRREVARTCRRRLDGSTNHFEPSNTGMEERATVESSSQLPTSSNACVPHAQSSVECRRDWSYGILTKHRLKQDHQLCKSLLDCRTGNALEGDW